MTVAVRVVVGPGLVTVTEPEIRVVVGPARVTVMVLGVLIRVEVLVFEESMVRVIVDILVVVTILVGCA